MRPARRTLRGTAQMVRRAQEIIFNQRFQFSGWLFSLSAYAQSLAGGGVFAFAFATSKLVVDLLTIFLG